MKQNYCVTVHRGQRLIVAPEHIDYMNTTSPSTTNCFHLVPFLGRLPAALYCFYFHRKCPERPERCQYIYIYIYIYIYVNNMADAKSVQNLSAIFR